MECVCELCFFSQNYVGNTLELIHSARCLFVFDLTGSFVISKCYGFAFKQLPHSTQINKMWQYNNGGDEYTRAHHRKIITMTTILIKHPSQWYEWWSSWWITEKKGNEKNIHDVLHCDCPHKLLFVCEILQRLAKHTHTALTRFVQGEKGKQCQIHNEHWSKVWQRQFSC